MRYYIIQLTILITLLNHIKSDCSVPSEDKIDCGTFYSTEDACLAKGCCWVESDDNSDPWCYLSSGYDYTLNNLLSVDNGYTGQLSMDTTPSDDTIDALDLEVTFEENDRLHVKISADNRYEVPEDVLPRPDYDGANNPQMNISFIESPFSFEIYRINSDENNGQILFDSSVSTLVFRDQWIQLSTSVDESAVLYGFGESTRSHLNIIDGQINTLLNEDIVAATFDANLYGTHPFLLQMVNGVAHGLFFLNSNPLQIEYNNNQVTFKSLGGILDFYFFSGPTPSDVVKQYTDLIGKPIMQPYWSLGFHNCRWGYSNIDEVKAVVANYSAAELPLETQWMDIDYMDSWKDFTYDPINFPAADVNYWVNSLHSNNQHFVPIIDPGIYIEDSEYTPYLEGVDSDLYVKDLQGNYYLGQVWPGPTYYPDFFNPKTQGYWEDQLSLFYDLAQFDGIWIDMNEASNFCNADGSSQVCTVPDGCPDPAAQTTCCLECQTVDPDNTYDFPPYMVDTTKGSLSGNTISMSSLHYNNQLAYNVHNLYGLMEGIATKEAVENIRGERAFVLTRSSYASQGKHTAHWTGDNASTWDDIKASIIQLLNFSLFGVSMVGSDICGFLDDTTEELCARWAEVGAFTPFSRNHNNEGQISQEYYRWESVTEAAKNAYTLRYKLLPVYYTLLWQAHSEGEMMARPLFVNFPDDSNTLTITTQWMLGSSLIFTPVLDEGVTSVTGYFPKGKWYSMFDDSIIDCSDAACSSVSLDTPLTSTNVHLLGGNIIQMQEFAMTTIEARETPFTILVALPNYDTSYDDDDIVAEGDIYLDNGVIVDVDSETAEQTIIHYTSTFNQLQNSFIKNTYSYTPNMLISTIIIKGCEEEPESVTLWRSFQSDDLSDNWVYDADSETLTINNLDQLTNPLSMDEKYKVMW